MDIITIGCTWDGVRLTIKPVLGSGWEHLTGQRPARYNAYTMPLEDVTDATAFELGLALAAAVARVTDDWALARRVARASEDQGELFSEETLSSQTAESAEH